MKARHLLAAIAVSTAALAGAARAQTPEAPRALVITAENLTAAESRSARTGGQNVLRPGDLARYRLTFTNTTPDSVRNVQFNDAVPAGLHYVVGSARADRPNVLIEFSIDSGRSYSERPEIEVVVNGLKVRQPAPPERYTHVRWTDHGWVHSKSKVSAEFTVQLPATAVVAANQ
jgi:uncharacterized repeat protein (TIGR01451 family)